MIRTLLILAVIVLAAFLVIGAVNNGRVKDNYGAPLGKVTERVVKDVSKGADVTYKEVSKKAKEISKDIKDNK